MKMKTIRATGIAVSFAALLVAAMAATASAACVASSPGNGCLKGTYAFRLDPATGFDADLASTTDPGHVSLAPRQSVMQAGEFTADGNGHITAGETFATTDDQYGDTDLIDFTWTGNYSFSAASDGTGTFNITPDAMTSASFKCYDMTSPTTLADWTASNPFPEWSAPNWAKTTVYLANAQIMPTSSKNPGGYVFQTSAGGTSGGTEPTWKETVGLTNSDGSVTWTNIGVPQQIRPSAGNAGNFVFEPIAAPDWAASTAYATSFSQIVPSATNGGNGDAFLMTGTVALPNWTASTPYTAGTLIYPTASNTGKYVFACTTAGTSGGSAPIWPQTTGVYVTDGSVVWESFGINGKHALSGASAPTWSPSPVTDGTVVWTDEGPAGKSGSTEPSSWGQGVRVTTFDAGIKWLNVGWAPLTPVACYSGSAPIWSAAASYSFGLSLTYGRVELGETDNSGGGAKIFMTGEAARRP
ncbi:MAG: hypothetical protein WA005_06200 [Candidatus Binataceae bacterium]